MLMRQIVVMFVLLLPLVGNAQTCKLGSILPTTVHLMDNKDGTVSDPKTGLVWKRCSEGQVWNSITNGCDGAVATYTWGAALERAQNVNGGIAGEGLARNDWRVPNINELDSIVEQQCVDPAINLSIFPFTLPTGFWSSSPYADYGGYAWVISFGNGYDYWDGKYYAFQVRLVRSGQ